VQPAILGNLPTKSPDLCEVQCHPVPWRSRGKKAVQDHDAAKLPKFSPALPRMGSWSTSPHPGRTKSSFVEIHPQIPERFRSMVFPPMILAMDKGAAITVLRWYEPSKHTSPPLGSCPRRSCQLSERAATIPKWSLQPDIQATSQQYEKAQEVEVSQGASNWPSAGRPGGKGYNSTRKRVIYCHLQQFHPGSWSMVGAIGYPRIRHEQSGAQPVLPQQGETGYET
jgi:hypothetical protein